MALDHMSVSIENEAGKAGYESDCHAACYDCGETVLPGPREQGGRFEMKFLVAYDIANDKRLRRVMKICEDYGVRVQKSVFECDLEPALFEEMWDRLCEVLNNEEDFLAAYPLCRSCQAKVMTAGIMIRPQKFIAYIC